MLIKQPRPTSADTGSNKRLRHYSTKFIPNLKQLNKAIKELPDPELWPESSYLCPIDVEGKQHTIEFSLKSINRGQTQASRWTYEGRILIRKRDSEAAH
ncbi:hypothetical protein QEH59_08830 [Coraliomargarita sp. SDUM461004]|uniref:Uncharacterized protein n=1 Tax=Thalassobacterium sedimentorum TaxID=3041258 RepID=A0ABU1AI91_9BACT|nr:hypothetical protein [Coraliomargarita sp. SDUM461004]MDQ8194529.1 hypothetical protein [Coraliomargarita sp. SDUM461004]